MSKDLKEETLAIELGFLSGFGRAVHMLDNTLVR